MQQRENDQMAKSERKSSKEKRKPKTADKSKTKSPAYLRGSEKPIGLDLDRSKKGSKK
jgi:hypothetical protein